MKILWQVSFRPLNQSKSNDSVQNTFLDNVKKFDADITFSITQFDDYGVKNFLKKKKLKKNFLIIQKNYYLKIQNIQIQ
ncbi:MAG TPA: hypothetical protein QGF37_02145 [Candidatus Pelagibacter bacterium]|nr:hypothetical protein [Candidatus Pelagibacter bacterium]